MNLSDPRSFTIATARSALDRRELSSTELTRAMLDRIACAEPALHALLEVTEARALADAAAADARLGRGETGPLLGIPVVLKDIFATRGIVTTCGSRILEGFRPPYDSDAAERLARAGSVLVGKANLDEFAMGSSNENSAYGSTRNPWDLERVPGGSSGGSAAAVAAGECLASLGTDTGGSIRLPASFCGLVGLKPTYGRVSRYGVIAYASSLDQVGPFAWTVEDIAAVLGVIAGHDPRDSTSVPRGVPDYTAALTGDVRGLRIGIPREYFADGIAPDVEGATRSAIRLLESQGAQLVEIGLPHTEYAIATYYLVATAEASSNLARYDGVRFGLRRASSGDSLIDMYRQTRDAGFGPEVKRRILLGTYALSAGYCDAYYLKALQVRTLIRRDFLQAFEQCDVIAAPTAPTTAFRLGEKVSDPLAMYLSDIFTTSVNLAGLPGLSLPCGADTAGLPIGLQIIAPAFAEEVALRVGDAYQRATEWHLRRPAEITGLVSGKVA
ncbi:MAG: Asp-tRNA(Asn)/Glu-tRNA(Gln) amidotransferase subunit GatA [Deltaproteobacteria bacterium]|nr:Asp-tRNA(Asn)/Glu-tRNA(Gln) amidotransferase subunit GatA [Deltaproteobacteria bacterium]